LHFNNAIDFPEH